MKKSRSSVGPSSSDHRFTGYFSVFEFRRRFQLYHTAPAPTAAPASKSHVIDPIDVSLLIVDGNVSS